MQRYVGPYRILRLIDRGGQGSVYLGWDERLRRSVAVKIYDLPVERAGRRRLLAEARLVAGMDSPRIVQVHDVIESSTHLAMIMEYIPGCSLEDLLCARRLSLASVLSIGIDIAGALAVARQQHVVHGDVKASNVLIGPNGRARLTDFGISGRTGGMEARRGGSLSAVAPELYAGEPVDERADLFALGLLLYRMLTDEHPFFRGGHLDPTLLLGGQPPPLRERAAGEFDLSGSLVALVEQLLARDPQQRPRNTRRVRQVLRAALRDIPLAAHKSLLREARPHFRPELSEDMPPRLPDSFDRDARSRLPPRGGRIARLRHWLRGLRPPARAILAATMLAVVAMPLAWGLLGDVTRVRFAQPEMHIDGGINLPAGVSPYWLVEEVKRALAAELGPLEVVGSVGAEPSRVIDSPTVARAAEPAPDHRLRIALRCLDKFCVVDLGRTARGERHGAQAIVFPESRIDEWGGAVRGAVRELFSRH